MELVRRTRATLRSAEFGFFGVCVYTRMHTPRFSGQPINAGDFVLTWTFSRPIRTNCENVGTVSLFYATARRSTPSRAENFCPPASQTRDAKGAAPAKRAHKNCARAHSKAERSTANPEKNPQQETPYAFQKAEIRFWLRFGEAHSALRGWRPIPAALPSHSVFLCSGTEDIPSNYSTAFAAPHLHTTNYPDKQRSIRKRTCPVKSLRHTPVEISVKKGLLAPR